MAEPIPLSDARRELWRTRRCEALARLTLDVDALHAHSYKRILDVAQCYLPREAEARVLEAVKQMTRTYNEAADVLRELLEQFSETRPPVL